MGEKMQNMTELLRVYKSIYSTAIAISAENDFESIIRIIVDGATELLMAEDAAVYIVQEEMLLPIYSNSKTDYDQIMNFPMKIGEGLSGHAASEGKTVLVNVGEKDPYSVHVEGTDQSEDDRESVLSAPMYDSGSVIGVITVSKFDEPFTRFDVETLEIFTRFAELEIKRSEVLKRLNESENKYRTLVEESHDGILLLKNGIIEFANDSTVLITGYPESELIGRKLEDIIVGHEICKESEDMGAMSCEREIIRRDGQRIFANLSFRQIFVRDSTMQLVNIRDLTEFYQLQNEKIKNEKLQSLGILAGGIAHDFNNLLTVLLGSLSLMRYKAEGEDVREIIDRAEYAGQKAKHLTQQLLTFSKGGKPLKTVFDINQVIEEAAQFVVKGTKIILHTDMLATHHVFADPNQISQVIHNIVINAIQAMPSGGDLTVESEDIVIENDTDELQRGEYVLIRIRDTGKGIEPEHLGSIFDPYFSTKESGNGLGLAIVYSIVSNHNGHIYVNSEMGNGTEFSIYIPASSENKQYNCERGEMQDTKRSINVLVMDDERYVREVMEAMLVEMGHSVCISESGDEALDMIKAMHEEERCIDVAVLDLTVPGGKGGKEIIREIKETYPDIKVIVSSGYSTDPIMSEYSKYGFDGVIPKPYEFETVKEILNKLID